MLNNLVWIKENIKQHRDFNMYLAISIFVTLIDVAVSRIGESFSSNLLITNTLGVVTGFIIQYFLTSRHVYKNQSIRTLIIFFATFLMGLVLANGIVYLSREFLFHNSESFLVFAVSKGFSIVIPFFVMYFVRKSLIKPSTKEE